MIRAWVALCCIASPAMAQDFQVGSRAKAMGGSYTAFGDDPVAIWTNPAGTATQVSQMALTFQSFTQYEFNEVGDPISIDTFGDPEQGLLDPPISPAFLGGVWQVGEPGHEMALSLAYVRPFQISYVYAFDDPALGQLLTQTDQQFSRFRVGFAFNNKFSGAVFNRLAIGVALDFAYAKYKEVDQNPDPASETLVFEDSESAGGYGLGLLTTVYESDKFQIDFGAAYNSGAKYEFDLDKLIYPVWDWPGMASAGLAFYVGEGYPLRLTIDAQWIAWKEAVGEPDPTQASFSDTVSFSVGGEYRFQLKEGQWLYSRAGFKSYDTPWDSASNLPAVGLSILQIATKGDRINIMTLGGGYYWSRKTAAGDTRISGVDVALELFGETDFLMGLGYLYQFD